MKRASPRTEDNDKTEGVSLYWLVKHSPAEPNVCTIMHLLRKGVLFNELLELEEATRVRMNALFTAEDQEDAGHLILNVPQLVHLYMCSLMDYAWEHTDVAGLSVLAAGMAYDISKREDREKRMALRHKKIAEEYKATYGDV